MKTYGTIQVRAVTVGEAKKAIKSILALGLRVERITAYGNWQDTKGELVFFTAGHQLRETDLQVTCIKTRVNEMDAVPERLLPISDVVIEVKAGSKE